MGDSPNRLAVMRSQINATERLYKMAGITHPRKELDVAEIYEVASWAELAMYENLGFCRRGEAGRMIDQGVTEMGGELPVNPSGGVLCTNCIGATAMIRVAEAAVQVMGKGGKRQVDNVKTALATGYGGNAWCDALILTNQN
jgi:acetyl-CoA C-acetyltransferase